MNHMTQAEQNREFYDDVAKYGPYAVCGNNLGGLKSRYIAAVLDAALLPLLQRQTEPVRLLDFGCGTGIFTVKAQPYVRQIVGADVSAGLLKVACEFSAGNGREVSFVQADGLSLPFSDSAVNRIVAREVLGGFPDEIIADVLAELARVLEPGGKFYLLDQVSESPKWQRAPVAPFPPTRKRGVDEIIRLFKGAGFELESAVAVRRPRFPWIYLFWLRMLPPILIQPLARLEVLWNRYFCPVKSRRWQDDLFIFRRIKRAD